MTPNAIGDLDALFMVKILIYYSLNRRVLCNTLLLQMLIER